MNENLPEMERQIESYQGKLLPVLAKGPGVCGVCHSWSLPSYNTCMTCHLGLKSIPTSADAIGFVSLAVRRESLANELWRYKDAVSEVERDRLSKELTALLWRWLLQHESCVERTAGVDGFPVVTSIPSTKNRTAHPLETIVKSTIPLTRHRYRALLQPAPGHGDDRKYSSDRFIARDVEPGQPVLVVDDTFTTGSRIQGAASALKAAGSGPVGAIVIGRHFRFDNLKDDFAEAAHRYLLRSRALNWDWDACCLCDGRRMN